MMECYMNILIGYGNSLCRDFMQNHMVSGQEFLKVITVSTVKDCLEIARDNMHLDVIGLDLKMPDMDGVNSLKEVRQSLVYPMPIALIGPAANRRSIRDLLMAGASGYLTYSMSAAATLSAIKLIANGETFVPVDILADEDVLAGNRYLTGREHDVLSGLLAGSSNKEIARSLNLSEVTIKHHLKSLRSKLGAKNRTHAVCRAIELGIS
jgi:two-component system nitrate/nitrite response regulator NarL